MVSQQTREMFETIARVLLVSTVLGFLLLLLWFGLYMSGVGPIYRQGEWFGLTPHEVDVIHYSGMAFLKLCVLTFFLFPYISIRFVLRRTSP